MLFKTQSAAVYGIDASIIEASTVRTLKDNFKTVGPPVAAVRLQFRVRPFRGVGQIQASVTKQKA